jgi:hypothetical protein
MLKQGTGYESLPSYQDLYRLMPIVVTFEALILCGYNYTNTNPVWSFVSGKALEWIPGETNVPIGGPNTSKRNTFACIFQPTGVIN